MVHVKERDAEKTIEAFQWTCMGSYFVVSEELEVLVTRKVLENLWISWIVGEI